MKIVIDIPDELYEDIKEYGMCGYCSDREIVGEAIVNGTPLDKIRAEIEQHRQKTQGIDPYDLVGDCLYIIDKYKSESEEV